MDLSLEQQQAIAIATAKAKAANPSPDGQNLADATGSDSLGANYPTATAATSGIINGIPVIGPALVSGAQDAAALFNSYLNGGSYADNLARAQGVVQGAQQEHPNVTKAGNIGGAVAGSADMMLAAPELFGIGDGPLLGRTATSTITGTAMGADDAGVRSGGNPLQTAEGAGMGFGTGMLGPIIGKGIGAGYRYLSGAGQDMFSELPSAAQKFIRNLGSPTNIASQQTALAPLGEQGMLADVSPEWQMIARGGTATPGSREAVVGAINGRQALANTRLVGDLNANLGPAVVPSQVEAGLDASRQAVGQQYDPLFQNASAVNTQPLADNLDSMAANVRGPERNAVTNVRGYLNIPETNVLDPNPQALFATRNTIDGLLNNEQNPQVIRQLTMARQQVDNELANAVPGIKQVDGPYQELQRQSQALTQGRAILNNGATAMHPQELDQMIAEGAQPSGQMIGPSGVPLRLRQGVRAEFDRALGTKANDTTAASNIVQGEGDWNRTKLGSLFGQDNADNALAAVDRERTFADTANRVTRGSDTSAGEGYREMLKGLSKPREIPDQGNESWLGLALKPAKKLVNAVLASRAEGGADNVASTLGRMAVATGAQRDSLLQALAARGSMPVANASPQMQTLINAVIQSPGRLALPNR